MFGADPWDNLVNAAAQVFGLGRLLAVRPLGGTASPKFAIEVPGGRFVVRIRPAEFVDLKLVRFDHEALRRLAAAGLPVPCPQQRPDETTWLCHGDRVAEVLSWVEGEPFAPGDLKAVRNVGRFLARFHAALGDDVPAGKEGILREDHPDLLEPYVRQLDELCCSEDEGAQVKRVGSQIGIVRENLDNRLWPRLPKTLIHGDFHPGNVQFRDSQVAAVYDFDYLNVQARVRDLADALMFFAARRDSPVDPDNIVSLTQPFQLQEEPARVLVSGYEEAGRLTDPEWSALPLVIRSLWTQIRLRGSRKVAGDKKVSFVLNRFFEVIDWLDHAAADFLGRLRHS